MLQFKKTNQLKQHLRSVRAINSIGFVPTMGALHEGHISLIRQSKLNNSITVCSIFVNPTQFNNQTDLLTYPKTIEQDLIKLINAGCDIVFLPSVEEVYQDNEQNLQLHLYENLITDLEAAHRPGHFNGVIDVVTRLFNIVEPNNVYFGQKDFQQCLVVKHLIKVNEFKINFHICPSIREEDGLAMSSRNVKLTAEQRKHAVLLSKTLFYIKNNWPQTPNLLINQAILEVIGSNKNIELEYLKICNPHNLKELTIAEDQAVALIAAKVGSTRLIDNITIGF